MPLPALYILLPMYSWGGNPLLTLLYRHHRPPSLSLHRIIQPPGRPLFPYQNATPPASLSAFLTVSSAQQRFARLRLYLIPPTTTLPLV